MANTFEQRRQQLRGDGSIQGSQISGSVYNSSFEQRRSQLYSQGPKRLDPEVKISQPIQSQPKNKNLIQQATNFGGNIIKTIQAIDFDRVKDNFVSGIKAVPSQLKTAGGVILGSIVAQQRAIDNFFRATDQFLLPEPLKPYNKAVYDVKEQGYKKTEEIGSQIRESGQKDFKKHIDALMERGESPNYQSAIAESMAFNLPLMAVNMGTTLATLVVTKNPLLASAVGFSTSYGLGASEVYSEARMEGLDDKQAMPLSMAGGFIIGAIDFIPLNRLIRKTGAVEPIKRSIIKNVAKQLVSTGTQAGFEGITESAQEIIQNAIAQTYNENKELFENVDIAGIVGALTGGLADVSISGISALGGKSKTPKQVVEEINKKIETALNTTPEKRSRQQQQIVDAVFTQEVTPDEALQIVVDNKLEKTEEGKLLIKTANEAMDQDKNVKVVATEDREIASVSVVDKEIKPVVNDVEETPVPTKETEFGFKEEVLPEDSKQREVVEPEAKEVKSKSDVANPLLSDIAEGKQIIGENIARESGTGNATSMLGKDLYSEQSPMATKVILARASGRTTSEINMYATNAQELALGQGTNTGIKINLDPAYVKGRFADKFKPTAGFMHAQGKTDEVIINSLTKDAIKSIEIPKRLVNSSDGVFSAELNSVGLKQTKVLPNGNLLFERVSSPLPQGGVGKVQSKKTKSVQPKTSRKVAKPIGKGDRKVSRLSAGVEAKAIEKELTENLGGLPEYQQVDMKEQAQLASDYLAKNPEKAIEVALGRRTPPANILPESIFIAVENKALNEGNIELLQQLATSVRTTEATAMGQRIRALAERNPDSAVRAMKEIIDERVKAVEDRTGKKSKQATKDEVNKIKERVKVPDKDDWDSFLNSIQC